MTFLPLDPDTRDIRLEDVAHALSLQCRFGGHCKHFYSVAEHCLRVSRSCAPDTALWGLMHDAAEAYLGDLPAPLKDSSVKFGALYRKAEVTLLSAVASRFGLPSEIPADVWRADAVVLATEVRDLMVADALWNSLPDPLPDEIVPIPAQAAERAFLERYRQLSGARHHVSQDIGA